MSEMPPEQGPKLMQQMSQEQPLILTYLLAVDEDAFNQDERELLLYVGVVIWKIMSRGETPIPEITEKILDAAEDKNIIILENLQGESDGDFLQVIAAMLENYNQVEVLRYVVEALFEDDEDDVDIREDNIGLMFIDLKTVIDCFDR
jgi:hypothetical protein